MGGGGGIGMGEGGGNGVKGYRSKRERERGGAATSPPLGYIPRRSLDHGPNVASLLRRQRQVQHRRKPIDVSADHSPAHSTPEATQYFMLGHAAGGLLCAGRPG